MFRIAVGLFFGILTVSPGRCSDYLIESAPFPKALTASGQILTEPLFLAAFADRRPNSAIYRGRAIYEEIRVDAAERPTLASSWTKLPEGDLSYLWHRELAYQLALAGFDRLSASAENLDAAQSLAAARQAGASVLLEGAILHFEIRTRGADKLMGTNFSGTNYKLSCETEMSLKHVSDGKELFKKRSNFETSFYNDEALGSNDSDLIPAYFALGLEAAATALSKDSDLRHALGLAILSPSGERPSTTTLNGTSPSAGTGFYWVNPKTAKRMDPLWNFDPADGTPRKDFVLRRP
jgi:hypothetical protein